jgi:phosphatidylglycerophosphate synthase
MAGDPTATLVRTNEGWLAPAEQRALDWLAPRLPPWLTPDRLTGLGFAASIVALLAYVLSANHPAALWLVNVALLLNWFGDSLDGKVARLKQMERPRSGLFLDQSIDVLSQFLFALGLAASGYVRPEIVAFGFGAYLMMTAQSLLRAHATGVFHLATGRMGLTEVRCLFVLANAAFFFIPPRPFGLADWGLNYADVLGILWIAVNVGMYVVMMVAELKRLRAAEKAEE